MIAFSSSDGANPDAVREVNLSLKHGVEAKNYDDVCLDVLHLS